MAGEGGLGTEVSTRITGVDIEKMPILWSSGTNGSPPRGEKTSNSEKRPWQPLETNSLNQKTAEYTALILQHQSEDSGFLEPDHPTVKVLQGYLDQMKDPNAPVTRVLIAKDTKESNAYVLPDGTIVVTQQLINDEDTIDEVVAILAHEQHHFEKNHFALANLDWEEHRHFTLQALLGFTLGRAGLSRVHEYDADFGTPAKLNALGMDTMALASALRKIGRSAGKEGPARADITHGSPLDRALNISLAHRVIDFPSILELQQSSQQIPPEWKQQVQASLSSRLHDLPANDEYRKLLEQTGPVVLRERMHSLYPRPVIGELLDGQGIRQLTVNKKFDIVSGLVLRRIEKSDLTSDDKRRAYYLCLSENANKSYMEDYFKFSKFRGSLYEIKPADFSEEGLRSIISLHRSGKAYEIGGLKSITTPFPQQFVGQGELFKQAVLYPLKVSAEMCKDVIGGDLSAERIVDMLIKRSKVVEETEGEHYAKTWVKQHINILMSRVINDHKGQATLTPQILDVLRYTTKQYSIAFSTGDLVHMASQISGIYPRGFEKSKKAKELFGVLLREVRSPDPKFETAIRSRNFEDAVEAYIQNPADLKQQLAHLVTQPGKVSAEVRTAIVQILARRVGELHFSEQTDLFAETEKDFKDVSLPLDLASFDAKTIEQFGQISYCLDIIYILTSGGNANERVRLAEQFLQTADVTTTLRLLPLPFLDSLYRKFIAETKYSHIWSEIATRRPVETQYDLFVSRDAADRSTVVSIVLADIIRDKLLAELPDNSSLEEVRKRYEYYRGLFENIYEYSNSPLAGPFWGVSQVMAEKIAPLTGRFLEVLSRISPSESSAAEMIQLYDAIKKYLQVNIDRNRILSALTERIIQTSPFDDALKFLEKEGLAGAVDMKTIDQFIEKRVFTYQEFLKCKQTIAAIAEDIITKPNSEIGALAIIDTLFDWVSDSLEMVKILESMIESGKDDTALRTAIAPAYWRLAVRNDGSTIVAARGYRVHTQNGSVAIDGPAAHTFPTFDSVINTLYNLNDVQKMMVLRKLFISAGGILTNKQYAAKIGSLMTKEIVAHPVFTPLIQTIIESSVRAGDPVRSFLPIAQAFLPHILLRPTQKGRTNEAAQQIHGLIRKGFNVPGLGDIRESEEAKQNKWTPQLVQLLLDKDTDEIVSIALATNSLVSGTYRQYREMLGSLQRDLNIERPAETQIGSKKVDPIEVILTVGQGLGPPGKRFLQVMGQYFDLPPEQEEQFREVYDANPGQSKYTAFAIAERLAKTDKSTQELFQDPSFRILKRIGGGSINTTFLIETSGSDGNSQLEVLRVKNPNAERFVVETLEEAEKTLEDMKQKNPKDRSNYQVANRILTTIREWVLSDINDQEFPGLDKQFSVLHNRQKTPSGVDVEVPSTSPPYNMYLKREEFVSGRNLNRVIAQARRGQEGDIRNIANKASRATAELFVRQLTQPAYYINQQPVYLALSDVHAGNVMVCTPEFAEATITDLQKDGMISTDDARRYLLQYQLQTLAVSGEGKPPELVIKPIDRTYYMKLNPQDRAFLQMIYSDQPPQNKLQAIVDYFLAQPENQHKKREGVTAENLFRDISGSLFRGAAITMARDRLQGRQTQTNGLRLMTKVLHEFDRRGISIPLKIRIIQKNVDAINKMLLQTDNVYSFSDYLLQRQTPSAG